MVIPCDELAFACDPRRTVARREVHARSQRGPLGIISFEGGTCINRDLFAANILAKPRFKKSHLGPSLAPLLGDGRPRADILVGPGIPADSRPRRKQRARILLPEPLLRARAVAGRRRPQVDVQVRVQERRSWCWKAPWAANKRFEISKFKFKFPRARTYEMIGLVLGWTEAKFCK